MRKKNPEAVARGRLRSDAYSNAKTALAVEQAPRIEQLRQREARELIEASEVRRFLVDFGASLRTRLVSIEKRLRAAHPGLDPTVYAFVREANEDALTLLSQEVLRMGGEE
jgi:phage terminase Nu1 subunit (DNA packaging protein)